MGGSLLGYFTEHSPAITGRVGTADREIAVCIQEPGKHAKDPIRTISATSWGLKGAASNWRDKVKIPLIEFLGPGVKQGTLSNEAGKLVGHPDFDAPQRLDIILTHEFCHAYLQATKVTDVIDARNIAAQAHGLTGRDWVAGIEEMLVCGLLAGAGLGCCENAYRLEIGEPPRRSYGAVGIRNDARLVPELDLNEFWTARARALTTKAGGQGLLAAALEIAQLKPESLAAIRGVREATTLYKRSGGAFDTPYNPTAEDGYRTLTPLPSVRDQIVSKPKRGSCTLL